MNKTAIKNFAVWARNKLIADITYRAGLYGVSENGIAEPLPQSSSDLQFFDIGTKDYAQVAGKEVDQRKALVKAIQDKEHDSDYATAFKAVIEEVAYTWFNRLIAIRFMEVNDYLPSRVRVLSSENQAKNEPDFVTTPFDTDMEFTTAEQDTIMQLKDENKLDDLFRMLFIKQCNKLHEILPELFENTNDYTELLLSISFTDSDGIVYHLVHDIDEDDFNIEKEGQVEIIGWMYQYYISEKHDQIINIYKGTIKKEDIPAATQLFTTDWVVRYMVDNSLARYWIERNPESKLAEKLEFFVTPKNGEIIYNDEKVEPTELTFFDPCMGSGHILVYAFDVLMQIYEECGYSDRDAALNIVQHNLFGLDIDKRAYQLAYFAVMMKARSYNRRALTQGILNNLAVIEESNYLDRFYCEGVTTNKEQNKIGEYLIEAYKHAKEIGALQTIEKHDYKAFAEYLLNAEQNGVIDIFASAWVRHTRPMMEHLTKQAYIMSNKYAVVCTNPPYMGKMEGHLKKFVVDNYKPYSGDLFSVFMYRNFDFCKKDGYSAFMTPFVWMFIKTYEALRNYIIESKSIVSLVQMEYSAFEEATVPICSFVLQNTQNKQKALCFRLSDFKGGMEIQKQKVLEAQKNKNCRYFYETEQSDMAAIPGSPVAYWVNPQIVAAFKEGVPLGKRVLARNGMKTGDNGTFIRLWWEISKNKMNVYAKSATEAVESKAKWFPYNKGGEFRKWYGNNDYVVNWENGGSSVIGNAKSEGRNVQDYPMELKFVPSVSWSLITSSKPAFRYKQFNISDIAGMSFFADDGKLYYYLGFSNTAVALEILKLIAPTINFQAGDIARLPLIKCTDTEKVEELVKNNIEISKSDWDTFETSWDFQTHPLVPNKGINILFGMKIGEEKWIKVLQNGSSCFSPVDDFIRLGEKTGNNEQGDKYEGVFARLKADNPLVAKMIEKLGDDLEIIYETKYVLLRRKSCRTVPIFCMYGFYKEDSTIVNCIESSDGTLNCTVSLTPSEKMYENFLNGGNKKSDFIEPWGMGFSMGHLQSAIETVLDVKQVYHRTNRVQYDLPETGEYFIEPTKDYPELNHKTKRLSYQKEMRIILPDVHQAEKYIVHYKPLNDSSANIFQNSAKFKFDIIGHKKGDTSIEMWFARWMKESEARFNKLKANEEELNRIFIDIYGLHDELIPEVEDKDVTIRKADLQRDIKSLLSYAVGCMFGRYSLDTDGLAYAGGEWDDSKYSTFIPDKDNCIPITDEPYFEDDIVGLFCAWLKKVYGEDTLEENLDFIAKALGNKGSTSREVIRNYFLNDFIKDHIKTYQKRPIYWLFDSGKQNGFKALVYMHRWDADTVGNLRVEYLHKTQRIYEREIQRMQETMDNSHDSREINKASKHKEKLQKQLKETKDYDTMLAHIALSRIDIDLDDGVKVNYEKVQIGRDGKKMQILAKI